MQESDAQSNQKLLKKLRKKADLCRFSHSELKEKYAKYQNWKGFSVIFLSAVLVALINFYYRGVLAGNLILSFIFILPLVIMVVEALDSNVFQWTHKATRHEAAVAIWGNWLREADFLEKRINQYSSELTNEKMQNIQEKYNICMSNAEQIPNNKFLKYKKKFRVYVLKSQKIDEMSLEDIERKKG